MIKTTSKGLALVLGALLWAPTAFGSLINGGFETGDFTGWTQVSNLGGAGCQSDWAVRSSDTICNFPSTVLNTPPEGNFAAYNSFDGAGPINFIIEQSVTLNRVGEATLSWQDSVGWNFNLGGAATQARVFNIDLLTAANALIGNVYNFSVSAADALTGFQDWTARSFDVTNLLTSHEGETIKVRASVFIPQNFTGPATLGIDNVDLKVVPEPSILGLFGVGLLGFGLMRRKLKA